MLSNEQKTHPASHMHLLPHIKSTFLIRHFFLPTWDTGDRELCISRTEGGGEMRILLHKHIFA